MKMIDLKRPKPKPVKEAKNTVPSIGMPAGEERPYCMRFTMEKPELEAMGMKPTDFTAGKAIQCMVEIDPITVRNIESKAADKYDENRNQSVEFQVLKIGDMKPMAGKKQSAMKGFHDENAKGPGE
ncbi:MAG: hypothetical protein LLG06_19735 [Desulfobacteraceae bacterium]|nr:hypothetical protein [Desulfobacteraceae bacterium]